MMIIYWHQVDGWGYTSNFTAADVLQKLKLPILSKKTCGAIEVPHSPSYFTQRLDFNVFCAGYVNSIKIQFFLAKFVFVNKLVIFGVFNMTTAISFIKMISKVNLYSKYFFSESTAVCNGDSGGALVVERKGVYFVRGIISVSVSNPNDTTLCNLEYPALFTDVAKYRQWISTHVGRELYDYDVTSPVKFE